jgi:hypothetical protein
MKQFDYQAELKKIIETKQLVEVDIDGPGHGVAYILNANDEYLTFAKINNNAALDGVIICPMTDVNYVQTDTTFISELAKHITGKDLHQQAIKVVDGIKEFTFEGFISGLENTRTIIEFTDKDEDSFSGRILGHNDKIIVVDEYYTEDSGRFARSYVNRATISRIVVASPWLNIITRSLADKNL